jgi:hypothetical protein
MTKLRFGADAKASRNTGTWGTPVWNEINNVNDALNQGLAFEEADATVRVAGTGVKVKMSEPTLLGVEISWRMLEDLDDADFLAIRTAFFARTPLDIVLHSGPLADSGETFLRMEYKVFNFAKGEPLNGINTHDVTIKPCYSTNAPQYGVTPMS